MPDTILSLLTNSGTISITDERNNTPVMEGLSILEVQIKNSSDVSVNPLADTQLNSVSIQGDNKLSDLASGKVIKPSQANVKALSRDISITSSVINIFNDLDATLQIISRSSVLPSMVISQLEIIQDFEMVTTDQINISFSQISLPDNNYSYSPQASGDESNIGMSIKSPVSVSTEVTDFISQISNTLGI